MDHAWYKTAILTPMRETLLRTSIVRTAANTLAPIHSADGSNNIWFPSGPSKEIRRAIWRCCKNWIPDAAPGAIGHRSLARHHLGRVQQADARPGRRVCRERRNDRDSGRASSRNRRPPMAHELLRHPGDRRDRVPGGRRQTRHLPQPERRPSSERPTSPGTPETSTSRFSTSSSYWETTCATSFSMWRSRRSLRTSARRTGPSWSRRLRRRLGKNQ